MSDNITRARSEPPPRHTRILIIGSGFAGLGLAVRLSQQGYTDFLVLERADDVGGTWRDNTYPGAACDVPSQLYSYSFALNPHWSRSFSSQPEIQRYIRSVADRYAVRDKHIFGCEVTAARWNDTAARWEVQTTRGAFTADIAVSAAGPLCEPKLPDIKGIHTFRGKIFHSARWDHDADLTGKRIAVIGTGASAIQIVPSIAPAAARLDVYQRSAPWVLPRVIHSYSRPERFAYQHIPGLQRLVRAADYAWRETFVLWQNKFPPAAALIALIAYIKMRWEIRDPALRRKVRPNYRIGCKRMLISNDYYPALGRDNVDLVTDGIKEIREHSIVSSDGTERAVDAIVLATGFRVADSPTFDLFTGRDGRTMSEVFDAEGVQAYKGTTVANFPNAFVLLGANAGFNYTSIIYAIESQITYVLDAIATLERRGVRTFEVRKSAQDNHNRLLREKTAGGVWLTGGCTNWFTDKHGHNTALWPDFSFRFRRLLRKFDLDAYETTPSVVAVAD
ncbi:cation diffusion facilitator CzcD-associated flavoprotein CzcO [Nocardia tenerifensis]|uniref:Cation diffusion facilitator CzcD-associated flavoprotein CzcO n=1 Tax=Nocardia tenerifensis TaxID=228006 RepID=A0A318KHR1_9NOCA|nr:NAD(P)/FAD-dependent oxidoreductase [Nocardia tenerifensis]PXX71792.1 cation diffusion facilitator CzcD-associated flavoprotein CzcO [Nocardia tenerifensis]